MKGYTLSRAAVADLDDIWDYTFDNWGQEQADRYINDIREACEALGSGLGPDGRSTISGRVC